MYLLERKLEIHRQSAGGRPYAGSLFNGAKHAILDQKLSICLVLLFESPHGGELRFSKKKDKNRNGKQRLQTEMNGLV
mgnify:CR=1 FL=1